MGWVGDAFGFGWVWVGFGLGLGSVWVGFGFSLGWVGFGLVFGLVWLGGGPPESRRRGILIASTQNCSKMRSCWLQICGHAAPRLHS